MLNNNPRYWWEFKEFADKKYIAIESDSDK